MTTRQLHEKRHVWLVKDEVILTESLNLIKLPHPGIASKLTRFVITENKCYEVKAYNEEEYRSWFVDQYVVSDGRMYLLLPIDPIFLILPHFRAFSDKVITIVIIIILINLIKIYDVTHR